MRTQPAIAALQPDTSAPTWPNEPSGWQKPFCMSMITTATEDVGMSVTRSSGLMRVNRPRMRLVALYALLFRMTQYLHAGDAIRGRRDRRHDTSPPPPLHTDGAVY